MFAIKSLRIALLEVSSSTCMCFVQNVEPPYRENKHIPWNCVKCYTSIISEEFKCLKREEKFNWIAKRICMTGFIKRFTLVIVSKFLSFLFVFLFCFFNIKTHVTKYLCSKLIVVISQVHATKSQTYFHLIRTTKNS